MRVSVGLLSVRACMPLFSAWLQAGAPDAQLLRCLAKEQRAAIKMLTAPHPAFVGPHFSPPARLQSCWMTSRPTQPLLAGRWMPASPLPGCSRPLLQCSPVAGGRSGCSLPPATLDPQPHS